MRTILLIFLVALAVTGFSTPWVKRIALSLGFVDAPSKRKLHLEPMPLLGGVAIFGGAILVLAIYFGYRGNTDILAVLLAATIIAAVGLVDDRIPLPASIKFGGQIVAFLLVIYFGVRVQLNVPPLVNYGLTFVWFAIITNSINFLDNMDGLCAGVSGVASAFIVVLATLNGQFLIAPMAAAIFGACLGFLRYNFKPARIFMGDAGSLFLGFLLAVMTVQLRFPNNSKFVTWMVPLLILGVPLFDLSLVIVSRLRRGVNPLTTAGKDHTSHRLVRMGYSQREAVLMIYLLGCAVGLTAILVTQATVIEGYSIGATFLLISAYGIAKLERYGISYTGSPTQPTQIKQE